MHEKAATKIHDLKGRVVNKNDLVAAVADGADLSKALAKVADLVFDPITGSLKGGEKSVCGLRTFSVANRSFHGSQSAHRRSDTDPGFQTAEVQSR